MPTQSLLVHIDSALARRVRVFLGAEEHGYSSLSEFTEVALLNQLDIELNGRDQLVNDHAETGGVGPALDDESLSLVLLPAGSEPVLVEPAQGGAALFILTNRLSPLKVATRVLANLGLTGQWPKARDFQEAAAAEARRLGLELRERDRSEARSGSKRMSIGYPVGKDEQAALDRFIFSFTVTLRDGQCIGPLATLGLANSVVDRIALTEAGWALATAPSPLLDYQGNETLSEDEARILRNRIREAADERAAVAEFMSVVKKAAGAQGRVDELLASLHPDWSSDLTIAHRSAMLGRLSDARAIAVSGRGPMATITVLPVAAAFDEQPLEEAS